jgi:hypothetical protein
MTCTGACEIYEIRSRKSDRKRLHEIVGAIAGIRIDDRQELQSFLEDSE